MKGAEWRGRFGAWVLRRFRWGEAVIVVGWFVLAIAVMGSGSICPFTYFVLFLEGYLLRAGLGGDLGRHGWRGWLCGMLIVLWPMWVTVVAYFVAGMLAVSWAMFDLLLRAAVVGVCYAVIAPWVFVASALRTRRPRLAVGLLVADYVKVVALALAATFSRVLWN